MYSEELKQSQLKKGDCYHKAISTLFELYCLKGKDGVRNVKLVHGYPIGQGPIKGIKHGHAWLEIDDEYLIDPEYGFAGRKEVFYRVGQIDKNECRYYTFKQTRKMLLENKHYGIWHGPDYKPAEKHKD